MIQTHDKSAASYPEWLRLFPQVQLASCTAEEAQQVHATPGGVDAITIVSYSRWDLDAAPCQGSGSAQRVRFGGFLKGIDLFDAVLFGITSGEADLMDPQQRLLMEVSRPLQSLYTYVRVLAAC